MTVLELAKYIWKVVKYLFGSGRHITPERERERERER